MYSLFNYPSKKSGGKDVRAFWNEFYNSSWLRDFKSDIKQEFTTSFNGWLDGLSAAFAFAYMPVIHLLKVCATVLKCVGALFVAGVFYLLSLPKNDDGFLVGAKFMGISGAFFAADSAFNAIQIVTSPVTEIIKFVTRWVSSIGNANDSPSPNPMNNFNDHYIPMDDRNAYRN